MLAHLTPCASALKQNHRLGVCWTVLLPAGPAGGVTALYPQLFNAIHYAISVEFLLDRR